MTVPEVDVPRSAVEALMNSPFGHVASLVTVEDED